MTIRTLLKGGDEWEGKHDGGHNSEPRHWDHRVVYLVQLCPVH